MSNKEIIIKLLKYIDSYKYHLVLSIAFALISVILTLYTPILAGKAIDCAIGKGAVDFQSLRSILTKLGVVVGVSALCQWLMNVCNNRITYNVSRDMRKRAFKKIQILPCSYIDNHAKGDIVSRVITDVDQVSDGLLLGFSQFFTGIVTIIGTLVFMLMINVWITLVVVVITPMSFFLARFIARKTYSMFLLQSQTRGEQTSFIDEMISNQKIADAYSMSEDNLKRFNDINERLSLYSLKATFFSSLTNPGTRFVNSIVYAFVALIGAILVVKDGGQGVMTVGILSSFLAYATQYTKPFNEISSVVTELQNAIACAGRVIELIEEKDVEKSSPDSVEISDPDGKINISNLSFSYNKEKELLKNLNVDVKPGMTVAIVGPTGCGKTTLINLLMRFYDADRGDITLDKESIYNITLPSLRGNIGMVLQDTWLKSGTIKENIALGKKNATDEEIISAAKAAHSHSFIKRLSDGYDTYIGEDGGSLSQGQKQLLCITRLMLSPPPVLILDEATSSIDTRTEIRIQMAFNKLMEGRTTFIVAHRLSTVQNADIILVMKDGNIIEQGSHNELLSKKGFYYSLYNSQFPKLR